MDGNRQRSRSCRTYAHGCPRTGKRRPHRTDGPVGRKQPDRILPSLASIKGNETTWLLEQSCKVETSFVWVSSADPPQAAPVFSDPRSRESRRVPLYDSRFGRKPSREKSQYLVAGGDRRLTRGIDEMLSDDAVRARYVLGKEWRDVRVRGAVGQLAGDEAVSEGRRVRRKTLGPAEFVAFESIGEHCQVLSVEALANSPNLIGRDFQPCRLLKRQ